MENLSAIPSTGYTPEEIEQFKKKFRTMSYYEESISTKELIPYLQSINFIKPMETYQQYIEYGDRLFGGRYELTQIMKYIGTAHDSGLLVKEYLKNFDLDNDGFVSQEDFKFVMQTIQLNDPKRRNISYEKFLIEADTNKDGKISVAKCEEWVRENYDG